MQQAGLTQLFKVLIEGSREEAERCQLHCCRVTVQRLYYWWSCINNGIKKTAELLLQFHF